MSSDSETQDWSKPAAMAIPRGYFQDKVDQGHYGPHREFLEAARAEKSDRDASEAVRPASLREGRQGRHLDDEPVLPPDRRHAQKRRSSRENKTGRT